MRMHVPLATLAQLVRTELDEGTTPGQLGQKLGIDSPAIVTATEVSGDAAVLQIEGVDPALADAEGWITAEWCVDAGGTVTFGGFKGIGAREDSVADQPEARIATLIRVIGGSVPDTGEPPPEGTTPRRTRPTRDAG